MRNWWGHSRAVERRPLLPAGLMLAALLLLAAVFVLAAPHVH